MYPIIYHADDKVKRAFYGLSRIAITVALFPFSLFFFFLKNTKFCLLKCCHLIEETNLDLSNIV